MSEALVSGPALPSVGFDGHDLPAPERFDSFHDGAAPILDARPLDGPTDFHSVTRNYLADGVLVSRLQNDPSIVRRDRRHLSDGSTDWISIQLFLGGMASGVVRNDRDLRLSDGSIGIVDLARPYTASISRSDLIAVCIPRDRIAAADTLCRTSPSVTLTLESSRGRMLADAVRRLWWSLGQAREVDGPLLADGIIESLDQVLRPGDLASDSGDVRMQAERFIEENLEDPGLDARSVGAAVGYSRSALYRFFDDDGGSIDTSARADSGAASTSSHARRTRRAAWSRSRCDGDSTTPVTSTGCSRRSSASHPRSCGPLDATPTRSPSGRRG